MEKVNSSINSTADVECPKQLRLWSVPSVEAWLLVSVRKQLRQIVGMTKALYGLYHICVTFPIISTGKLGYLRNTGLFGAA